jgi:hypothetical protein
MKLAKAINWTKKELRWSDAEAWSATGSSKAAFYRGMPQLVEAGFFKRVNGNLVPTIPESHFETPEQSHFETETKDESQNETKKSHFETPESHFDDTYSEDSLSVDSYSEEQPAFADAQAEPVVTEVRMDIDASSDCSTAGNAPDSKSGEAAESQSETNWKDSVEQFLNDREKAVGTGRPEAEVVEYAVTLLNKGFNRHASKFGRIDSALTKAAVVKTEDW